MEITGFGRPARRERVRVCRSESARRGVFRVLGIAALALLAGCHERQITRTVYRDPSTVIPPDSARYGRLTLHLVREVRRPRGIARFPDGGTPIEMAVYYEVRQRGPGRPERVIGRLPLRPVRRGDFGNIYSGRAIWPAPDRLRWWVRHGYDPSHLRTDTAELVIPQLGSPGGDPR